jgi:hypothetical protein
VTKGAAWAGIVLAIVAFATMIVGLVQRNFALMLVGAAVIVGLRVAVGYARRRPGGGPAGMAR